MKIVFMKPMGSRPLPACAGESGHPCSQMVTVLVSSQMIKQAKRSLACLKSLVDVKQLILSFFGSQTFLKEADLSAEIAVFELSQNPLSKSL